MLITSTGSNSCWTDQYGTTEGDALMRIHIKDRVVEVDDEQFTRLDFGLLVDDPDTADWRFTFPVERLLNDANDLVSEQGENPEYDRALVELCSAYMRLTQDDRDLVTLLVGVRPRCTECNNVFDDNPGKQVCKTCQDWMVTQ